LALTVNRGAERAEHNSLSPSILFMHVDESPYDPDDEEVAFWRGFIEWWARERDGPAPPRAWEALDHANREARLLRDPPNETVN
jgi:hypothetical protein